MNSTDDISSMYGVCNICQINHGFSSADQRALIILIVIATIVLISCYIGVLWFTIRTRLIPDKNSLIILENIITNQAFDHSEDEEINVQTMNDTSTPTTPTTTTKTQPMTVISDDKRERF